MTKKNSLAFRFSFDDDIFDDMFKLALRPNISVNAVTSFFDEMCILHFYRKKFWIVNLKLYLILT